MADTQSRKYQLTINNPKDKQLDHDALKIKLAQLKSAIYWCMSDEIGLEAQTPHTHIFIQLRSPARFSRIKSCFLTLTSNRRMVLLPKTSRMFRSPANGLTIPRPIPASPAPLKSGESCQTNRDRATAPILAQYMK